MYKKKRKKVKNFNTLGTKTFCVPLEKPERVREEKDSKECSGRTGSGKGLERD